MNTIARNVVYGNEDDKNYNYDVNKIFNSFFMPEVGIEKKFMSSKNDKGLTCQFNVAGFDKSELSISLEENKIRIIGEKKDVDDNFLFRDKFDEKYIIEGNLTTYDFSLSEASYKNGILTYFIPFSKTFKKQIKIS